jgi:putative component of membrane protein insertase Oxa1/YidC/SpoIIIJ protein YidD
MDHIFHSLLPNRHRPPEQEVVTFGCHFFVYVWCGLFAFSSGGMLDACSQRSRPATRAKGPLFGVYIVAARRIKCPGEEAGSKTVVDRQRRDEVRREYSLFEIVNLGAESFQDAKT